MVKKTDLVKRLRSVYPPYPQKLMQEAADEIERLRDALRHYAQAGMGEWHEWYDKGNGPAVACEALGQNQELGRKGGIGHDAQAVQKV